MKKVVRMLGLCALVALAFTACKKDDTEKVSFTATITQPTSTSRTHTVGYGHHLVWDASDQIKVFNNGGMDEDFALPNDLTSAQTATFTVEGGKVAFIRNINEQDYYAFYPQAEVEGERVKMVIPENQTYVSQRSFLPNLYPMVGFNVNDEGNYCDNFTFISNAGFLTVPITCPAVLDGTVITEVILRTPVPEDKLYGAVYYDKDGSNYEFVGEGNEIHMTAPVGDPVVLLHNYLAEYTFVLPEGALAYGFELEVHLDNGEVRLYEAPAGANTIEAMTYTCMLPVTIGDENQLGVIVP